MESQAAWRSLRAGLSHKVRGMGLVDAVKTVLGSRVLPTFLPLPVENPKLPGRWTFYPPKLARYSNRAVSYLQQRGISPEVICRAMQLGILCESRYYNPKSKYHNAAICVFAGKDEFGKVVFAAMRGIDTDFKQDKAGSDKRFNFCIPARKEGSRHLAVFEAPIDALSHATLQQRDKWNGYRLSLGGTSSIALTAFLERHPQISRVMLHLDNDTAGYIAARNIKAQLHADRQFKHIRVSINPPRGGKDYNEVLQVVIRRERESQTKHSHSSELELT